MHPHSTIGQRGAPAVHHLYRPRPCHHLAALRRVALFVDHANPVRSFEYSWTLAGLHLPVA
jgi:hypothetical protein